MAQPDYVPLQTGDRVRRDENMPVPDGWKADRPADHLLPGQPTGRHFGTPAPDGGYGLKLVRRLVPKLRLTEGVSAEDAVLGLLGVGLRRAGVFGRAPILQDFELAATVWGFLGQAPNDLVAFRRPLFSSCSHSYSDQRDIVDLVPESTLRMSVAQVEAAHPDWKSLLAL
jgi:hypothetical protein